MKITKEAFFYYTGCTFIVFALCLLTVFPFFINQVPYIMFPVEKIKKLSAFFYFLTFIFYFFSPKYHKKQFLFILFSLAFFLLFQYSVKNF